MREEVARKLQRLEAQLDAQAVPLRKVVLPIDRWGLKLGVFDRPLSYMHWARMMFVMTVYWMLVFPLALLPVFYFNPEVNWSGSLLFISLLHLSGSVAFGVLVTLLQRFFNRRIQLPSWESL